MTKKYAVYDTSTGENSIYQTKEEALQAFWKNVVSFAISYFHNTPYTVIETNADGSETWYNDKNEEIQKPLTAEEIEQQIENTRA